MLRRVWRPRVLIYGALLLVLGGAFVWSLSNRNDFVVAVSRDRGALARMVGNGNIENTYRLQITNSTEQPQRYTARVSGVEGLRLDTDASLTVGATSTGDTAVRLVLPATSAQTHSGQTLAVVFQIGPDTGGVHELVEVKSTFIVPRY
ncbi:cytochrome c oxidase accessory protein CcoG [compost metagenome]